MATLQKITPNFWFAHEAEEAAKFYTSIFKDSSIGRTTRYSEEGFEIHKMPAGSVMTVEFTIAGMQFVGLNGGPLFKFNESISFVIDCEDQEETDYYWGKLNQDGDPSAQQCGWLKDKFGVSWQVVPSILNKLLADPDREKANRVMHAMLRMKKIDIAELKKSAEG